MEIIRKTEKRRKLKNTETKITLNVICDNYSKEDAAIRTAIKEVFKALDERQLYRCGNKK